MRITKKQILEVMDEQVAVIEKLQEEIDFWKAKHTSIRAMFDVQSGALSNIQEYCKGKTDCLTSMTEKSIKDEETIRGLKGEIDALERVIAGTAKVVC